MLSRMLGLLGDATEELIKRIDGKLHHPVVDEDVSIVCPVWWASDATRSLKVGL